ETVGATVKSKKPNSKHVSRELTGIGSWSFEADDIIAFARAFDPQPFHLSEGGGRASLFGGLCASGWHTTAAWLRLYREQQQDMRPIAELRDISWRKPVMAGSTISFFAATEPDGDATAGEARLPSGETIFRANVYFGDAS
ncbi:MAG: MaoC/PaaZ C-terminal domain-containing protein, partial [Pseudomonadota bacterium]